ncbi:MAG: glyoxalase superfamily protein [Gammaproteobacteria bacterium]|nr:glyoxalase superfamily protein [Gammaproteobacteria bacterium]MDD9957584.1 glyoxalase superfamily protein [Gammaproteobacteria bacterium]
MAEKLIPILHTKDGLAAAAWYSRLGFEIEGEHRFAPGMPLYLFLRRGNDEIHLSEHKGDARPDSLLYFWVSNIDELAREFGTKLIEQPWAKEIHITDPDGHRFRVGQRHENDS